MVLKFRRALKSPPSPTKYDNIAIILRKKTLYMLCIAVLPKAFVDFPLGLHFDIHI